MIQTNFFSLRNEYSTSIIISESEHELVTSYNVYIGDKCLLRIVKYTYITNVFW